LPVYILVRLRHLATVIFGASHRGRLDGIQIQEGLVPQLKLVPVVELEVELGQLVDSEAQGENILIKIAGFRHFVQVALDEDRALESASGGLDRTATAVVICHVMGNLLLLDANEHLAKEIAFQLLPGNLVLAYAERTIQTELAKPTHRQLELGKSGFTFA
jgi:hypothetical protein